MSETAAELLELTQRYAVIRAAEGEEFTLASGIKTTYYFDGKRAMLSPDAFRLIGELVWRHARQLRAEAVGGLAAGSIPMSDAAIAYDAFEGGANLRSFYVRDDGKKLHGTRETVYQAYYSFDGHTEPLVSNGRRVLIVDDVLTTGTSMQLAIDEVEARGAEVVGVFVLIDRQDDRSSDFKAKYPVTAAFESDDQGNLAIPRAMATV